MVLPIDPLEKLWDRLLSQDPASIKAAFQELDSKDQKAVLRHLNRMATEPGWLAVQKASADYAIQVLTKPEG